LDYCSFVKDKNTHFEAASPKDVLGAGPVASLTELAPSIPGDRVGVFAAEPVVIVTKDDFFSHPENTGLRSGREVQRWLAFEAEMIAEGNQDRVDTFPQLHVSRNPAKPKL